MADNFVKMSANLPREAIEALKSLAQARGTTVTEVLKAAIGTEKFLADSIAQGGKVLVEQGPGKIRELVFPEARRVK